MFPTDPMRGMTVAQRSAMNGGIFTAPGGLAEQQLQLKMRQQQMGMQSGDPPNLRTASENEPMCQGCSSYDEGQQGCGQFQVQTDPFQVCDAFQPKQQPMPQPQQMPPQG